MIIGDLEHILEIKNNKDKIESMKVIEKLRNYIIENHLTIRV